MWGKKFIKKAMHTNKEKKKKARGFAMLQGRREQQQKGEYNQETKRHSDENCRHCVWRGCSAKKEKGGEGERGIEGLQGDGWTSLIWNPKNERA